MMNQNRGSAVLIVGARQFVFAPQVLCRKDVIFWGVTSQPNEKMLPARKAPLRAVFVKTGLARRSEAAVVAKSCGLQVIDFLEESELFQPLERLLGIVVDPAKAPPMEKPAIVEIPAETRVSILAPIADDEIVHSLPCVQIRPCSFQPRQHFDKKTLRALSQSIARFGQQLPAIVIPVKDKPPILYELLDGQRRWTACQMAGILYLKAVIRKVSGPNEQYFRSAISNFGREEHLAMEIANALARVRRDFKLTQEELAEAFAQTPAWVNQHLGLLRLCPEVQALLDPDLPYAERIGFGVAVAISKVPPERQMEAARHILEHRLKLSQVWHYIRRLLSETGGGRHYKRKPVDDFRILRSFLAVSAEKIEQLLTLPEWPIERLFQARSWDECEQVVEKIDALIARLKRLRQAAANRDQSSPTKKLRVLPTVKAKS